MLGGGYLMTAAQVAIGTPPPHTHTHNTTPQTAVNVSSSQSEVRRNGPLEADISFMSETRQARNES